MLDLKEAAEKATDAAYSQTLDFIDAQNKAVTTAFEQMEKFYGEVTKTLPDTTALTDSFKKPFETLLPKFEGLSLDKLSADDFKIEPMSYDTAFKFGLGSFTLKGGFEPLAEAPEFDALTPKATLNVDGKDYTLADLKDVKPEMPELSPESLKPVPASYDASWIFGLGAYKGAVSFEPLDVMPELDAYMPSLSFTKGAGTYTPADLKAFFTEKGETFTAQFEDFQKSYTDALSAYAAKAEDMTADLTKQVESFTKALPAFDMDSFFAGFMPTAKTAPKAKKATSKKAVKKKPAKKKAAVKAPKVEAELEIVIEAAPVTPPTPERVVEETAPATVKSDDTYASYLAKVQKYDADANADYVTAIVKYCGIALSTRDGQLVACSDPLERDRVRDSFLIKKLGLTGETAELDAKVLKICDAMKADRFKDRVTFYYLLAQQEFKLAAL